MISLYSTWWVKPGKEQILQPALGNLARDVERHEKGTLMYLVHAPRYDFPPIEKGKKAIISEPMARPETLIFVEKYESWEAFKTHLYGPYFKAFVKENKSLFVLGHDNEPFIQVVFLDEETGFIRRQIQE